MIRRSVMVGLPVVEGGVDEAGRQVVEFFGI